MHGIFSKTLIWIYIHTFFCEFCQALDMFFSFLLFSVLSDSKNAEILHLSQFESEFHV